MQTELDIGEAENELLRKDILKLRKLTEMLKTSIEKIGEEVMYVGSGDVILHSRQIHALG